MVQELGRIERPSSERFAGQRKLFLVPWVYEPPAKARDGLVVVVRFWNQVKSQVASLESRLGPVQHLYHETVTEGGSQGLKYLEAAAPRSYSFFQQRCQEGVTLEATEDLELLLQVQDLQRCLMLPFGSYEVTRRLHEWLTESTRKRYEHIAQRLNETLKAGDTGLLIVNEHHQVQFPQDVQVFYVSPPALDEYRRWLEGWMEQQRQEAEKGPSEPSQAP